MKRARSTAGFSLAELLVTLAILGILSAIAIPSYTAYIQRANRSDVRTQLLEAAAFLQRSFSQNNQYPVPPLPQPYTQSPATGAAKYTIAYAPNAAQTSYTLTATRAGTMSNDECGDFTLTNTGLRGVTGGTATVENCWGR